MKLGTDQTGRLAPRRLLAAAALGLLVTVTNAGFASAHVHVSSADAVQGGYTMLTFRVPTESDTASTVKVSVTLPKDTPIVYAGTQPTAGWSAKVATQKLTTPVKTDDGEVDTYVSQVTWTADKVSDGIKPGEFQLFNLSIGPLPKQAQLNLPVLQSYSDGSEVNWNQVSSGSTEPEHPAPVLDIASASTSSSASASAMSETMDMSHTSSSTSATGVVGIVMGGLALVLAAIALLRTRRLGSREA